MSLPSCHPADASSAPQLGWRMLHSEAAEQPQPFSARTLFGAAPWCDGVLPDECGPPVQCVVFSGSGGTFARSWADQTRVNSASLLAAELRAGDVLSCGKTTIEVVSLLVEELSEPTSERPEEPPPTVALHGSREQSIARQIATNAAAGWLDTLRQLRSEQATAEATARQSEEVHAGLNDQIARLQADLNPVGEQLQSLEQQVSQASQERDELIARVAELNAQLARQEVAGDAVSLATQPDELPAACGTFADNQQEGELAVVQDAQVPEETPAAPGSRQADERGADESLDPLARLASMMRQEPQPSIAELPAREEPAPDALIGDQELDERTSSDRDADAAIARLRELSIWAEDQQGEEASPADLIENQQSLADSGETSFLPSLEETSSTIPPSEAPTTPLASTDASESELPWLDESASATGETEETTAGMSDAVEAAAPSTEGGDEDIEAYMQQLLQRMRGEQPAVSTPPRSAPLKPAATAAVSQEALPATASMAGASMVPDASAPLTSLEDMAVRRTAPEKTQTLAAMRDLANQSARSAIDVYAARRDEQQTQMKMLIGGAGFLGGSGIMIAAPSVLGWMFIGGGVMGGCSLVLAVKNYVQIKYKRLAREAAEAAAAREEEAAAAGL